MPNKRQKIIREWCLMCGNEFTAHKPGAMYCGSACKQKAYRQRKGAETRSNRYGKSVNKTPADGLISKPLKSCPHCGKRFRPGRKDQKFCGASCRVVANRNKQARTMSKLKRETGKTDFDLYQQQDKHGWDFMYLMLENMGFIYSDSKELWVSTTDLTLSKLL